MVRRVSSFNSLSMLNRTSKPILNRYKTILKASVTLHQLKKEDIGSDWGITFVILLFFLLFTLSVKLVYIAFFITKAKSSIYVDLLVNHLLNGILYYVSVLLIGYVFSFYAKIPLDSYLISLFLSCSTHTAFFAFGMIFPPVMSILFFIIISVSSFYLQQSLKEYVEINTQREGFIFSIILFITSFLIMMGSNLAWGGIDIAKAF